MSSGEVNGRQRSSAGARHALLLVYGLYAVGLGALNFLKGGFMVFAAGAATEANFVGHITEAHACTLIGLGCVALGVRRLRANLRHIYSVIFLASLLGFFVAALSTPVTDRGSASNFMVYSQLLWAALFSWLYYRDAGEPSAAPALGFPNAAGWVSLTTFAVLVTASGLVWLLAPLKFATAAAGSLAGASAAFAGQTRGVADISLGIVAWTTLATGSAPLRRSIIVSLLAANALLVVAGLFAQLSVLYTPTRWVVEGLHMLWVVGFAWAWMQLLPRGASPA
jgi:hypothetical protein